MHVANLELCKELYELSGWEDTNYVYTKRDVLLLRRLNRYEKPEYSAYDLGYLLRKLPKSLHWGSREYAIKLGRSIKHGGWAARYWWAITTIADTPEDALCLLAIELIKQNIITPNGGQK